jgi:hypothetical protein
MDMTTQPDVVQHGHAAEDLDLLKGPGYPQGGALIGPQMVNPLTIIYNIAFLGSVKTIDAVHHNGFAGPVGSNDRMNFTFSNLQADAGQGFDFSKGHMNVLQIKQNIPFIQCI